MSKDSKKDERLAPHRTKQRWGLSKNNRTVSAQEGSVAAWKKEVNPKTVRKSRSNKLTTWLGRAKGWRPWVLQTVSASSTGFIDVCHFISNSSWRRVI